MSTTTAQPATTPIPVQLSESEFTAFLLPHLSLPNHVVNTLWVREVFIFSRQVVHSLHAITSGWAPGLLQALQARGDCWPGMLGSTRAISGVALLRNRHYNAACITHAPTGDFHKHGGDCHPRRGLLGLPRLQQSISGERELSHSVEEKSCYRP
jgi:hypothetical protein